MPSTTKVKTLLWKMIDSQSNLSWTSVASTLKMCWMQKPEESTIVKEKSSQ